jgi:ribosomal protein S21
MAGFQVSIYGRFWMSTEDLQFYAGRDHLACGVDPGSEAIDAALRRLRRSVAKARVLSDLVARQRGVTPAGRQKLKARRALNRLRRNALRTGALDAEPR